MTQVVDYIVGRRRGNEQQWRARLRRFETSGSTVVEFCQGESVSIASFYEWRKRLAASKVAGKATHAESNHGPFVPVRVRPAAKVEIHLPNGARVCLAGDDLAVLRAAIEAAACATTQLAEVRSC
ncbi:MAG: hypothetical protein WA447_19795 [Candidatus Binatus sp.]